MIIHIKKFLLSILVLTIMLNTLLMPMNAEAGILVRNHGKGPNIQVLVKKKNSNELESLQDMREGESVYLSSSNFKEFTLKYDTYAFVLQKNPPYRIDKGKEGKDGMICDVFLHLDLNPRKRDLKCNWSNNPEETNAQTIVKANVVINNVTDRSGIYPNINLWAQRNDNGKWEKVLGNMKASTEQTLTDNPYKAFQLRMPGAINSNTFVIKEHNGKVCDLIVTFASHSHERKAQRTLQCSWRNK